MERQNIAASTGEAQISIFCHWAEDNVDALGHSSVKGGNTSRVGDVGRIAKVLDVVIGPGRFPLDEAPGKDVKGQVRVGVLGAAGLDIGPGNDLEHDTKIRNITQEPIQ